MKCVRCGFENVDGAGFCGSCGLKLEQISQEQLPKQNKKSKKKILIVSILFTVTLVITILFLVFNKSDGFKDPFQDIDDLIVEQDVHSIREYEEINFIGSVLESDFKENKITADKYIMQLAYSIYDFDKLDNKYKDLEIGMADPNELFKKAGELADSLSLETATYIVKKYMLADVEWNVEGDTDVSGMSNQKNNDYKVMPVSSEKGDLNILNKAVLSSDKNFLIYYTTKGVNAITDEVANKIAHELERNVVAYETNYGLKFKYEPNLQESVYGEIKEVLSFGGLPQATSEARKVLKNSNIDTKYLDTAMPVFIIDTDAKNTNALAFYVQDAAFISGFTKLILKIGDLWDDYSVQINSMLTTYAFPYFVVSSSLDNFADIKIASAHEMFHHYQMYICGNGSYKSCISGNFTTETTANFAALRNVDLNTPGTILNSHAVGYIHGVSSSIDKVELNEPSDGYCAFVFASNYDEVVPDGYNYLFQSMKYENALKYLYDNSGGNYKKALLLTAERNLTLDYDNMLHIALTKEQLYYPENYEDIGVLNNNMNLKINYSSMQYFYIDPSKYTSETSQIIFNGNNENLSLLLFVKENNKYKYLYTHALNKEFVINVSDFALYDEVVFSIVNFSIVDNISYTIEVKEDGTKMPTVTAKELKLTTLEDVVKKHSSFMCHQIIEDEDWYNVIQVKVGFDKYSKLNEMYFKGTYKIKNYTEENNLAFSITKRIVSGLLRVTEKTYTEKFKNVETIIGESDDKYSVTFKITKNYYDALNENFNLSGNTKVEIIKSIQAEGFVCKYE